MCSELLITQVFNLLLTCLNYRVFRDDPLPLREKKKVSMAMFIFKHTQHLPLCLIYLYPMADRQDERLLLAAWQKHGLSQRFPTAHHLSRSLIWPLLSNQRKKNKQPQKKGNVSSLGKTHTFARAHVWAKHTSTQTAVAGLCTHFQKRTAIQQWQTAIMRARSS